MQIKLITSIVLTLILIGATLAGTYRRAHTGSFSADETDVAESMVEAANHLLQLTPADQQTTLTFSFEDEERTNWNFVPMPGKRKGMPLKAMSDDQRLAVHALLQSALSGKGYLKATAVHQLERILADIEQNPTYRDPELYYLTLFGAPSIETPWGWRFEGHHLSLNFSSVDNQVAVMPAFIGANPAEVRSGQFFGLRVLHEETDVARTLVYSLSDAQRSTAIIATSAPRDIITGNRREAVLEQYEGIRYSDMDLHQQQLLRSLIDVYATNLESALAAAQLERIETAGYENIYFAWAGSLQQNEAHYYRVHGPTLLIEYDNTQNNANHIHSTWRDLTNDFGRDLLRKHYDESSTDHGH